MRIKNITTLLGFIICILTISLLASGGCDIDFGGNNNGNNGGNGDGGQASIQGTITSTPNSGITVQLVDTDKGTTFSSDPTDNSGNFRLVGGFNGCLSLRLAFLDESQTPPDDLLAFTGVTVFPGARVDLGNISIDNRNVTFEDPISVDFEGNIDFTEPPSNTCSGGPGNSQGTIVVTADGTDVIVQIDPISTDIVDNNGDKRGCDDLFSGEDVEVTGELLIGGTVAATLIRLK